MILIDTSVVIEYARGKDAKLAALLPTVPGALCGVVRAELLCGARDPRHRASLLTLLPRSTRSRSTSRSGMLLETTSRPCAPRA